MNLTNVYARIRPSKLTGVVTEAGGSKGSIKKLTKVDVELEIGHVADVPGEIDPSFMAMADKVFPGVDALAKLVAGDEAQSGFDLSARQVVPALTVDVFPLPEGKRADEEPIIHMAGAECRSKPKLKINEDGDCVLLLGLRVTLLKTHLFKLVEYIGADVWIDAKTTQVDFTSDDDKVVGKIGVAS